jgi:GNAT superfamily N-acetyltransferase
MSNRQHSSIRKSRPQDLVAIEKWLKEEDAQGVHGNFLCNWLVIERSHRDGDLFVYIDGTLQQPIAFQVGGLLSPGILQVRSQYRARGIGRKMVDHCISVAEKKGEHLLYIQCKPSTSIPFWSAWDSL